MGSLRLWLLIFSVAVIVGGTLYIRLRWGRAPLARRDMTAVALAYFVAGCVVGGWLVQRFGTSSNGTPTANPVSTPTSVTQALPKPQGFPACNVEPAAELKCGSERWLVKTLSDPEATKVNFAPVDSTIGYLSGLRAPPTLPGENRIAPTELQVYLLHAVLLDYKRESDDDFHLIIADQTDRTRTMIVEIPAPNCADASAEKLLESARCQFTSQFVDPGRYWSWTRPVPDQVGQQGALIEVTGVGFFDFDHGQNGVAPNAIELHPVLSIRREHPPANLGH
jgi:hypothetical protein